MHSWREIAGARPLPLGKIPHPMAVWRPSNFPAPMLMILRKALQQFLLTLYGLTLPE
jgi:hypothetical protein